MIHKSYYLHQPLYGSLLLHTELTYRLLLLYQSVLPLKTSHVTIWTITFHFNRMRHTRDSKFIQIYKILLIHFIRYVQYFSKVYFWFLFSTAYLLNIELRNLATYLISWWEDVHWQHISSWTSGSLWDLRPILCKNCDQRQPHHATCLILRGRHSSRECRYWVINTVNHLIKIWM